MQNVRGHTTTYQLDYGEITLLLLIDIMIIIVELLFQIRSSVRQSPLILPSRSLEASPYRRHGCNHEVR